jgi:hypothetical protein
MFNLNTQRRRRSGHARAAAIRWMGQLERMEDRIVLSSNGFIDSVAGPIPGQFAPGPHQVRVTSIPQDADSNGVVNTTSLTLNGQVERPGLGSFTDTHMLITIDALSGTNVVGTVQWDTANPGNAGLQQDSTAPYRALFAIPVTLASVATPQPITLRVTVEGYGARTVVRSDNTAQSLTGTFSVDTTAPTIPALTPIPKRDTPLPSATVAFSEPIDPATFLVTGTPATSNVQLEITNPDGTRSQITLDPAVVTLTTTNNQNFTINGLTSYTTTPGTYRLSIVGKPTGGSTIADPAGNAVTGTTTQRVTFVIAPGPWVDAVTADSGPSTAPVNAVTVVFSEAIQASTFTTAAVTLQTVDWATFVNAANPGTPTSVPLPAGATITQVNPTTYRISGLSSATTQPGNYWLTVNPTDVKDADNNAFVGNVSSLFNVLPPNGAVGAAAGFKSSPTTTAPHHVLFTEITQDGDNNGVVNTPNLTFKGQVWRPEPGEGDFTPPQGSHTSITITAYETASGGAKTKVGEIVWADTSVADPNGNFTQGTGAQENTAFFTMPVTLLSQAAAAHNVSFEIAVSRGSNPATPGLAPVVYWQDIFQTDPARNHPLAATLTLDAVGPNVTTLGPISSPRNTPVDSKVDVVFSEAIVPDTFSVDDLGLTLDGNAVTLGSGVTITQVSPTEFTIDGLDGLTAGDGLYALTVDQAGILDANGNAGTGTAQALFEVDTVAPEVTPLPPVTSPRTDPLDTLDVTFSKPIDPESFTTGALRLTRDGQPVTLGNDVTITPVDDTNTTFRVANLAAYTADPGDYELVVDGADIVDAAGNAGVGQQTVAFTVEQVVNVAGPQVTNLRRFGYHAQPTKLVLNFDAALDAATAGNTAAYRIVSAGRDGRLGTTDDVVHRISRAIYDNASRTVTLLPAQRLYLFRPYRLTVYGTGANVVSGADGAPLDGNGSGQGGSNYVANFNRSILAGKASQWPIGNPTPVVRRPQVPRGVHLPVVSPNVPKITLAKPGRRGR